MRTLNNGETLFESRNVGTSTWLSPVINIASYTDIAFSIDASQGRNNFENTDTLVTEYRLDGGNWMLAANNGTLSSNYGTAQISDTNLNGNTLELRVTSTNTANNERHRFDNIEVTGTADCNTAFALPFNEGFEGASFPPTCWETYRGANGLGTGFDWTSTTLTSNSGNTSAFVAYEAVTGGNAEDWLVTPAIDLSNAQAQLRFFARDQYTINYNTTYSVRVSETSATDISSFTTVKSYTESTLGNTYNEKVIDLSAYTGTVYIAFVMEQNDGDNWFLDDISITDISGCSTPEPVSNVTSKFENNSIRLDWTLSTCYDEIFVVAAENNPVTAIPTGDGSAYMADANLGIGTEIVSDEFVVFKGIVDGATIGNVTLGNNYHFSVYTRKGNIWSVGVPLSYDSDYCIPTGDTAFYDTSITLVDFGSINNSTSQGSGYDDFTNQSTDIAQGASEDLTVQLNTDGNVTIYSYAWIDWNQDGDFDDAGETYDLGFAENTADGPTSNSALVITAPINTALGDTRLRVLCQYYNTFIPNNGPCDGSTDGEIEDYTVTVLPAITYTYDNGWLPEDPNGLATIANPIEVINGNVTISTNTSCQSFLVRPGAGVTINSGITLLVDDATNGFTLESSSTLYSSLILNGTINGTVYYKRHINSNPQNDLISAPLSGQPFNAFVAANDNLFLSPTTDAVGFATFDKVSGSYRNFNQNDTTPIESGIGFRTASTNNSTFTFTGNVEKGEVAVDIVSSGPQFEIWNLIGNPYAAYVNVADLLNGEAATTPGNPTLNNRDLLDIFAQNIYAWNGTSFDIINNFNSASTFLAPGQAFYVAADPSVQADYDIKFDPNMRQIGSTDDFIPFNSNNLLTFIKLKAFTANNSSTTDIYFDENTTLGLDPGYDAVIFGDSPASNLALYSELLQDNSGLPLAIQSVHPSELSNITIPLGVNANLGEQLTFSIEAMQMDPSIHIYLEDHVANTSTLLNTSDYVLTPNTDLQGTGRFYISFINTTLSATEQSLDVIRVKADNKTKHIVISGALAVPTEAQIIDVHGRVITKKALDHTKSLQRLDVNHLSTGIYIVQLYNTSGSKTVKVVLK